MRSPKSPSGNPRARPFDRHVSGTGTRGLPKKGGAGGKGVWGSAMDQQEGVACLDKKDPNYDSDQDTPPNLDLNSGHMPLAGSAPPADSAAAAAAPAPAEAAPSASDSAPAQSGASITAAAAATVAPATNGE